MLFMLSACGFQLRGDYQISAQIEQLSLDGPRGSEALVRVREIFEQRNIQLTTADEGVTHVEIGNDRLDRRILSMLSSGQVAEYELIYMLPVTITTQSGDEYHHEIQILRDYQDDPNFALAKHRELELLISEMRTDAAHRLLLLLNRLTWE
ncbi:LPS-assembly lipoprotein LptE [Aliidiomarina indica]|uniref:LPS-assembly lipoprotein LptE n=1 Tax=Aliidiomarina indica TaxID=2749147 RepID=UPI00188DD7A2|nr:LPS assembly lipoprotein LptE [Aliidiomarina indica]